MNKKIYWLASYPKSGNTWFRIFLANLFSTDNKPIDINQIKTGTIASERSTLDCFYGIDSALLSLEEIDQRRPALYNHWAENSSEKQFHKVHDAYTFLNGEPLLGDPSAQAAIYIVRNPLDVSVSFANHSGQSDFDQIIKGLCTGQFAFADNDNAHTNQLRQWLLPWHQHVASWLDQKKIPVHVMRYEDMISDPHKTFTQACQFAGLPIDTDKIAASIEASRFERLQGKEKQNGFKERPAQCKSFFRAGKVGSYQSLLTDIQIQTIIQANRTMMERLGYHTTT